MPTPALDGPREEEREMRAGEGMAPEKTSDGLREVVQAFSGAPQVTASQSLDFDEDDDLPRPGKVWDASGPSLKELLALESAKELGVPLPATALTQQMLQANMSSGRAEDDFCSVIRVLEDWAGVEVKKS